MLNAKNGWLALATGEMDYIRFGSGRRTLVMIPGVGDGLKTVRGMALPFALMYRQLAKDFTVYVFSRRVSLTPGMTTRDMAEDLNLALEALGLSGVCLVGVSQGGMIAQWLTLRHPQLVKRLILCVTLARQNAMLQGVVPRWIEWGEQGDFRRIFIDTAERYYTEAYLKRMRWMLPLAARLSEPEDPQRFLIQAQSCLTHDAFAELPRIACPTLVIGGGEDRIVTGQASVEIAGRIPDCRLFLYDGLGHGLYEEAPDFLQRVADFCR